jgi:TolA-binding protein
MTRLRLEDGELRIHVDHAGPSHHVVVALPDGELEDIGTTFDVRVQGGRTVALSVSEGVVVFRPTDQPPMTLRAGLDWHADPRPPVLLQEPPSPSSTPSVASDRAVVPSASIETSPRAPNEFRDAVALLEGGDASAAAVSLRSFVGRHPRDPRAQDASYLLVLALRRSGDTTASREAAHAYLRRYPTGFRRSEVEALAR